MKTQDELLRKLLELTMRKLRNEDISEEITVLEEKEKREEMMLLLEMLKRFWENEVNALLFSPKPPPPPFLFSLIPPSNTIHAKQKLALKVQWKIFAQMLYGMSLFASNQFCLIFWKNLILALLAPISFFLRCSTCLLLASPLFSPPFLFWKAFLKKCRDCSH